MDLFETLGLGPRQPEENELYVAIYADPDPEGDAEMATEAEVGAGVAPGGMSGGEAAGREAAAGGASSDSGQGGGGGGGGGGCGGGDPRDEAERLEALRSRCTAWILPHTAGYVWNKDPLVLRSSAAAAPPWERRRGGGRRRGAPAPPADSAVPPDAGGGGGEGCLWAVMRFGDAVDDEWWAVWLLLRMTRELQDLSVQVWDNDGQFLLIEAAYALPRWLKPELAANRVWLRRGRLHVIPLPSAAAPDLPASPTPAQALGVLREGRYATASPRVQRPIDERLAGYPGRAAREQQHVARCLLPAPLAAALRAEPQLVAPLVEAFYFRDADDMRAASRMRVLPPSVERSPALVRMTRCHYAQLAQQRFAPPRGLAMPPPDSPLAKAADLGLKLTVAAEILCARYPDAAAAGAKPEPGVGAAAAAAEPPPPPSATAAAASVLAADPAWQRFKASLESNGYFQGNIPGSKRYKELLAAAVEAFSAGLQSNAAGDNTGGGAAATTGAAAETPAVQRQDPRRRLAALVREAAAKGLRPEDVTGSAGQPAAEDDDSWLDQQPERLQAELERRQAELQEHASGRGARDRATTSSRGGGSGFGDQQQVQEVDADKIAAQLRGFMEQLSGLEGAETAGTHGHVGGSRNSVDFNPSSFLRELQKALGGKGDYNRDRPTTAASGLAEGDEDWDGEDDTSTSGDEGSSFFSEDEDDHDGDEEEDEGEGASSDDAEELAQANADSGLTGARPSAATRPPPHAAQHAGPSGPAAPLPTAPRPAAPSMPSAAAGTGTAPNAGPSDAPAAQPALRRGFLSGATSSAAARKEESRPPAATANPPAHSCAQAPTTPFGMPTSSGGASQHGLRPQPAAAPRTATRGAGSGSLAAKNALWEVSTATDSDDDEGSSRGSSEALSEEDAEEATARLMAALGVQDSEAETVAVGQRGASADAGQRDEGGGGKGARHEGPAPGGEPGIVKHGRGSDAPGDGFLQLYDAAMQAELAGTTLVRTFESAAAPGSEAPAAAGSHKEGGRGQEGDEGSLRPVDLDLNLVRNLLRSYTAQQGGAGPAGNMAGMLGLELLAGDVEE